MFDMKTDMNDLKKLVIDLLQKGYDENNLDERHAEVVQKLYQDYENPVEGVPAPTISPKAEEEPHIQDTEEIIEESLSLEDKEIELITKALEKYNGKRKQAAQELGISERTLYRKIKEYELS